MKRCVGCGNVKEGDRFYASKSTEDGLNRYCKWCCKVNRALEAVRKRDRRSKISYRQRYRANELGVECDTTITLAKLFKRDLGTCAGCGEWVKPRHASIDHATALVNGGTHTWGNVQLMHLICNLRKGRKEM